MRALLTRASLIAIVLLNAGCGGSPSSMPVITITPWVPPAALNPLVLSVTVKVTNKGSYVFLDSSGATTSKLIVSAKDKLDNPIGLPIEQDIKVRHLHLSAPGGSAQHR